MNCFSCLHALFVSPSAANRVADNEYEISGKSLIAESDCSDLSNDEGANFQQDLWQLVLRQKLRKIQRRQIPINMKSVISRPKLSCRP